MVPAATPLVVGYSGCGRKIAPPSVTCEKKAPRNDGDTGVVSAVGTPMLKSDKKLMSKVGEAELWQG